MATTKKDEGEGREVKGYTEEVSFLSGKTIGGVRRQQVDEKEDESANHSQKKHSDAEDSTVVLEA